jgi:hypothetical protein
MRRIKEDPDREERIEMEIIADAHDSEERALGWCYYLDEALKIPFDAQVIATPDFASCPGRQGQGTGHGAGRRVHSRNVCLDTLEHEATRCPARTVTTLERRCTDLASSFGLALLAKARLRALTVRAGSD